MDTTRMDLRHPARLIWSAEGKRFEACFDLRPDGEARRVDCEPLPGVGDVVAGATKAVGVKPCGGCKRRQAALNRATPSWLKRALAWLRSVSLP